MDSINDSAAMLSQILLKQGEMGTQLAVISEQLRQLPDHEQRIRGLERWKYSIPITAIATLGSIALAIASWIHQ